MDAAHNEWRASQAARISMRITRALRFIVQIDEGDTELAAQAG